MKIEGRCVVSIEYELTEAGKSDTIDSNKGGAPLEFITGSGQIIPGLEKELMNLSTGEKADIKVNAVDAYGEFNKEAIETLPREQFAGIEMIKDMQLYGEGENGESVAVTVKEFTDDTVTVDYNHPLAGQDLMFSIDVLSVREATIEEIATGHIGGESHNGDGSCGTSGGCGCKG